ncbi:endonuclease/exonuclease/phosphatase family protein [Nannocystis sp. ILAH1]|uniref:endonuclease/exonuclease/phosphatase family protein n=1 Tax=Nannocystis sp. ILAH1 TaxID=2996789 RepID=UPI002272169F|nr:endonuclease/exonuclease/phosphatase family protein [Nannocystis sp. ILAH1]MCY0991683.1 endonuclease/exonuclease/phosphatase family protein [Nannocystis sp. ILAH1]
MDVNDDDFVVEEEFYDDADEEYVDEDIVEETGVREAKKREEVYVDPAETLSDAGAPWFVPLPELTVERLDSGRSVSDPRWIRSVITIDRWRGVDIGLVTWNINHMNQQKARYVSKKCSIGRLFSKNDWLDVLVLQEINQVSLKSLPADIEGHGLQMILGPHMISIGPQGGRGQHEYYPIVFRGDRLACDHCWALHRGRWIACGSDTIVEWTKPQHKAKNPALRKYPSYRPIVVYRLINANGGYVYVANVHTTPKGSGLSRKHEFDQVRFILEVAKARQAAGEHWIVVGDYYLDPEASVMDRGHALGRAGRFEAKVGTYELELVVPLSATNQTGLSSISERYGVEIDQDSEDEQDPDASKKEKQLLFDKLKSAVEAKVFESERPVQPLEQYLYAQKRKTKPVKDPPDNFLADRVVLFSTEGGKRIRVVLNKRADFFICTRTLQRRFCGLVSPVEGILHVDPNHNALNWWCTVSDHAPIGAIFCSEKHSEKLAAYELEFNKTYWEELEQSKMELEKIHARVKFDGLQTLERLVQHLEVYPWNDTPYHWARRVCVFLTCTLALVGVDLSVVSRPIPPDIGAAVVSEEALLEFVYRGAFAKGAPRWSILQDTLSTVMYEAARAAYRCLQISGYQVDDFNVIDEKDTYDDRFAEQQ